ncbi:MAG: glycosyltransferase family 2 protein [Bacteroidetes bacterium]|nr:glycosyltransferase family 2 protein [Bacteroidota bacterium]
MKSVDILVSIVNWNSSNGLKECVNSFYNMLSASNYSFVIKIYDNNSTDESLSFQIVDEERIQVIRGKKNEGLKSHQYNLLNTEYKFLIVSNSDILYKEGSFPKLIEFIDSNTNTSVIGFSIFKSDGIKLNRVFHKKGFPSFTEWLIQKSLFRFIFEIILKMFHSKTPSRIKSALHRQELSSFENPSVVERVSGCVFMTTRKAVQQVGLFDSNFFMYAETIDFLKQIKTSGGVAVYYPLVSFIHYGGLSNQKRNGVNIQHNMSYFYYYKKHFGKIYAYLMCSVIFTDLTIRYFLFKLFKASYLLPKHSTIETLKDDIYYWLNKLRLNDFNETPYYKNAGD